MISTLCSAAAVGVNTARNVPIYNYGLRYSYGLYSCGLIYSDGLYIGREERARGLVRQDCHVELRAGARRDGDGDVGEVRRREPTEGVARLDGELDGV